MMAAEFRRIPYVDSSFTLVIKNYGLSVARHVVVSFEPPIPDPVDPSTSVTPFLKRRYERPIPAMTPGMEFENVYLVRAQAGGENVEPTPESVVVHLAYQGPDGHRYEDSYPLDADLLKAHTYATSSNSPERLAREAVKALKEIQRALKGRS